MRNEECDYMAVNILIVMIDGRSYPTSVASHLAGQSSVAVKFSFAAMGAI